MTNCIRILFILITFDLVLAFQLQILPWSGYYQPRWCVDSRNFFFHKKSIRSPSSSELQAKPKNRNQRPAKGGSGPKKKKDSKKKNETPKKTSTATTKPTKKKASYSSSSKPPWQVLSAKDAKKNIESEKIRRQRAREGDHTFMMDENNSNSSNQPQQPQQNGGQQQSSLTLSTAFLSESEQRFLNWKRFNPVSAPKGMKFVGSFLDRRLPPSLGVPEVAFLGRSNVGKSSLLNRLSASAGHREQARVGKTPGATASVNLYSLIDAREKELLGFADLPGFGYAKLSKDAKESVQAAAENYLGKRRELCLGILLVDIRREPSVDDRAVLAALYDLGVPLAVVATKTDKVSKNQLDVCLETIRDGLGLPEGQPLAISSTTGEGTRDLWKIILEACEEGVKAKRVKYDEETRRQQELEDVQEEELGAEDIFVDDEDVAYSQGYDWIHGSEIDGYAYEEEGEGDEYFMQDDMWEDYEENAISDIMKQPRESFQQLKQRAREMEKRGDV
jgi:GTP-binding protein